jgi:hypothetical protein
MWGNRLGWMISGGIAVLWILALWKAALPPAPTDPINAPVLAVALKPIALPVPADTVAAPGTADGDAGKIYRDAIKEVAASRSAYERFHDESWTEVTHTPAKLAELEKKLKAVALILKARECKSGPIFGSNPTQLINYSNAEESLDDLRVAGETCTKLGTFYGLGEHRNPEKSFKLFEAAFLLGMQLYNERLTDRELQAGHTVLAEAAGWLGLYYKNDKKDPSRGSAIRGFVEAEREYTNKLAEAWHVLNYFDEEKPAGPQKQQRPMSEYAGDIFKIAQSSEADPMFRVEALLHMGRYQYNCLTRGDQIYARKLLKKMADDSSLPGPVKAAATMARDLTEEDFYKLGGSA